MSADKILVVDDEPDICHLVKEILEDEGFEVRVAENGASAGQSLQGQRPDLALLDVWMPDVDGVTLLKEWDDAGGLDFPVIMMSGHGTVETAVEATRLGAYDFLEKPLSLAKLLLTVKNALDNSRLARENRLLRQYSHTAPNIIGKSKAMMTLRKQIKRIADHNTPVLITGESGTDKEAIARYLHANSERHAGPFISVALSSLATADAAVELFGQERQDQTRPGYLEQAHSGSLFLKDIADLDLNTQARLQHALEKQNFMRINGASAVAMDVRIIAAARSSLESKIREGTFRDGLYFQLGVVPIQVLPLREHYEDVPELLEYYVNYFVVREGLSYRRFTTAAQNRLRSYHWPGNIRELKNLVQRLLILGNAESIELQEIETILGQQPGGNIAYDLHNFDMPLRKAREKFERAYLEYQLKQTSGSVSKIARIVGMERTHLYRKLKSLGIDIKKPA